MDLISSTWFEAGILSIPLYCDMGYTVFDSWDDFLNSLRYWFQPDWLSLLRGEFADDFFATLKMIIFLIFCVAATFFIHNNFLIPHDL